MNDTVQTIYRDELRQGVAGHIVNSIPKTLISRTVEGSAGLEFGVAVAQGTGDLQCVPFGSGDTEVLGISVRERSLNANETNKFGQYDEARIMTKGAILVEASVDTVAGDEVWVVPATGAFQVDDSSSAVQIPNARYETSGGNGDLVVVRLG